MFNGDRVGLLYIQGYRVTLQQDIRHNPPLQVTPINKGIQLNLLMQYSVYASCVHCLYLILTSTHCMDIWWCCSPNLETQLFIAIRDFDDPVKNMKGRVIPAG